MNKRLSSLNSAICLKSCEEYQLISRLDKLNMASVIQETPTDGTSCSNSDVGEELSFLPRKLKERLLPFQKKGITFALEKNGRIAYTSWTLL
uniref:Uncharacterized protein n=1 Tax=Sphaerodactylus townsendi TaxID=933632 RepID=A0ACB8G0V9_9SAUR